jgi:SAM-dependent methyltransferase
VLGTHDAEIDRLGLQHRVWRPRVLDAWGRAGLTVGHTVVDVGCRPGFATMDLADIVGPNGHVHAVDRSARFLDALRLRASLPDSSSFAAFVSAVMTTWRKAGGEPDIGRSMPQWIEDAGLELETIRPIVDVVSPANFIWQWGRAFVEVGLDRLVATGALTADQGREMWREFLEREASPGSRMTTPIVLEIVARRH